MKAVRYVEQVIPAAEVGGLSGDARGARLLTTLMDLLHRLGDVDTGGLTIRLATAPQQLEQFDQAELAIRTGLTATDPLTYACGCGFEADDLAALLEHIGRHGARRLVVHPEHKR